jgi:hypothetical protein
VSLQFKYPLAFNADCERIRVSSMARGWRVLFVPGGSLRSKRGGAPEVALGLDGGPLFLKLEESRSELARQVSRGGLYRLDAVGRFSREIAWHEIAYVQLPDRYPAVSGGVLVGAAIAGLFLGVMLPAPAPLPLLPTHQDDPRTLMLGGRRARS